MNIHLHLVILKGKFQKPERNLHVLLHVGEQLFALILINELMFEWDSISTGKLFKSRTHFQIPITSNTMLIMHILFTEKSDALVRRFIFGGGDTGAPIKRCDVGHVTGVGRFTTARSRLSAPLYSAGNLQFWPQQFPPDGVALLFTSWFNVFLILLSTFSFFTSTIIVLVVVICADHHGHIHFKEIWKSNRHFMRTSKKVQL
ncbi:hypothetical protein T4B_4475 [Trichinella pseudospiralis]|uniref:Uncharacterized protein n=1 Tax=Trichinella pseudospiralis TaxID=6337 RepID=A0A0V1J4X0_TRIPS|nr:hypothetical protein T4A_6249 [Trichinella pseudospiralis]KRZ29701.1 hypothetical protein T4B_4475 [Trichinella pseudospiralis]